MKRLIKNIVLIALAALLVWGIAWASGKAHNEVCNGVDIEVINVDSTSFVTPEGIKAEMARMGIKAVGVPIGQIDVDHIENRLRESEYLESAECVLSANNRLIIRVKQIVPVLRVYDDSTSYYMNRHGKHMAASISFHADVPVVQGHFSNAYPATRLLPLVEHINSDPTLKALVTMISVTDSNNIFIVPSIRGHVVNLGPVNNLDSKFARLKEFYKNVLPHTGYEYYDTISVKWNHQVVGTKRHKAVKIEIELDSTDYDDPTVLSELNDSPASNNNGNQAATTSNTQKKNQ